MPDDIGGVCSPLAIDLLVSRVCESQIHRDGQMIAAFLIRADLETRQGIAFVRPHADCTPTPPSKIMISPMETQNGLARRVIDSIDSQTRRLVTANEHRDGNFRVSVKPIGLKFEQKRPSMEKGGKSFESV